MGCSGMFDQVCLSVGLLECWASCMYNLTTKSFMCCMSVLLWCYLYVSTLSFFIGIGDSVQLIHHSYTGGKVSSGLASYINIVS